MTKIIKILVHPSDAVSDQMKYCFVYLNINQIVEFYLAENGFTRIHYNAGSRVEECFTKESPDDLMARINDQKNASWRLHKTPSYFEVCDV